MATTTVSDFVIWTKHIHGDGALAERVSRLPAGHTIGLRVDGVGGMWRKMDDGKDGRATPGIRPLGETQAAWRALYRARRGAVVSLELADDEAAVGFNEPAAPAFRRAPLAAFIRAQAERDAALAALMAGAEQGWRSEGRTMTRDEAHER